MNIQQYTKWMLAAAAISAVMTPAHANTCRDQSPLMKEIGESYAQLQYSPGENLNVKVKDVAKNNMLDFFNNKRLRTGKGVRVSCMGADKRESRTKFRLEDVKRVETANGNIQITVWEDSSRKAASAVIDIPPAQHWKAKSRNTLSTTVLFRRSNRHVNTATANFKEDEYIYNGQSDVLDRPELAIDKLDREESELLDGQNRHGSHVTEIETQLRRNGSGMTLTQITYINGQKTEWVTWQLDS